MTTSDNQKTKYILKRGLIFFLLMFSFNILIEVFDGNSIAGILESKLANPFKLLISVVFPFATGLVIGWISWKQKRKASH